MGHFVFNFNPCNQDTSLIRTLSFVPRVRFYYIHLSSMPQHHALEHGRKCCTCNNGMRGVAEIAIQHEDRPSALRSRPPSLQYMYEYLGLNLHVLEHPGIETVH